MKVTFSRLKELFLIFPLSVVALRWCAGGFGGDRRRFIGMGLAFCATLVLVLSVIRAEGGFRYGPRYLHPLLPFLVLFAAGAISELLEAQRWWRHGALLLLFFLSFAFTMSHYRTAAGLCSIRSAVFRAVERAGISNALVFIGNYERVRWEDLLRNDPDLSNPVLYAHDLGEESRRKLLAAFPDREGFIYRVQGGLTPLGNKDGDSP